MRGEPGTLTPVLVYIQANLDDQLDLDSLSARAGLSASHFHRQFKAAIGETPSDYVTRLRLERGAFRLQLQDASILQIALDCGFQNHETFTRAFQRVFGQSPTAYRASRRAPHPRNAAPARAPSGAAKAAISATKVIRLREAHLAFLRHVGPYESVPDSLFTQLNEWATRRGLPERRIWMGIGHDAPNTTAPDRLRFDAALVVPGPFNQDGPVGHQILPGGDFAVTTHVGAFATLPQAYAEIFPRAASLSGYELVGLPAIEIYRAAAIDAGARVNETDICLPVVRR